MPLPPRCRVPLATQPLGQPRPGLTSSAPAHANGKSHQQQKEAPPKYPWPSRQQLLPVPKSRAVSAGKAACAGTDTPGVAMAGKGNNRVHALCGAGRPAHVGGSAVPPTGSAWDQRMPAYPTDRAAAAARAHAPPAPDSSPAASANSAAVASWVNAVIASGGAGGDQTQRHHAANVAHHNAAAAQRHARPFATNPLRVLPDDLPPVSKRPKAANPRDGLLPTVPS